MRASISAGISIGMRPRNAGAAPADHDGVPFGSPLLALVEQVRERRAPVNEYRVDVSSPRLGVEKMVDIYVAPVPEFPAKSVVVMLQERSMADKIDRQMTHRGAARSVTALAAMLAHEIKNPLSGIRGAAQLLESVGVDDEDRALTRLICDETDRIVKLVDRMEVFRRAADRARAVNIHVVLDHVKAAREERLRPGIRSSRTTIRRCRRSSATATS
jgi:two-component system nitrogen regulation sensor histidine kinase GlnL